MESCFWTNGFDDSIFWSRETGNSGNDGQSWAMVMAIAMVMIGSSVHGANLEKNDFVGR